MPRPSAWLIVVACGAMAAGCTGEDAREPTADAGGLVALHAARLTGVTDLAVEADGSWRARCDEPGGARAAAGVLAGAERARWRREVRSFDAPFASRRELVVRQHPGPTDYPVTTVNGRDEGGDGERIASGLHSFAARLCRRHGEEVPSRFSDPARPLTVGQAADFGTAEVLRVEGALVIARSRARLCEVLLESLPPQCGGRSLRVTGLRRRDVNLKRRGGVAWSVRETLRGVIRDDVLTIKRG